MPIKPVRNSDDLHIAKLRLAHLLAQSQNPVRDDEIEVLTTLVEKFENKTSRIEPPGPIAAIRFRMEEMGILPRHLEPFIGSRARVSEVLSGKRSLTIDMIRSLHEGLSIPYESLMARPSLGSDVSVPDDAVRQLNKLGFCLAREDASHFIASSLGNNFALALHRKTRTQRAASKTDPGALLLWQAAVVRRSEAVEVRGAFDQTLLNPSALRRIGRLSAKANGPRLAIATLSELGIATVVMPLLPGTFLDGAATINRKGIPVVGLTLRYDRIDNFWFTLIHELSHLCLHYDVLIETGTAFVDDIEIRSDDVREVEADTLARESLIPSNILKHVVWSDASNYDDLVSVSGRARVPLTVVAGRWQRDHQNYKKFSRLIDRGSVEALLAPMLA